MRAKIELFYRCSDEAAERLMRRQDGRDGPAAEWIGDRIARAVNALCDDIEQCNNGLTIQTADDISPRKLRKAFVPAAVLARLNKMAWRLPGVSRDQLVREALRRVTGAY